MELETKYKKLKETIEDLGQVAVAFSGGVDSTFLAKVCFDVLGEKALAITAQAPIHSKEELKGAKSLAAEIGIEQLTFDFDATELDGISDNPKDRCYFCKYEVFSTIKKLAAERGINQIVDGTNKDDGGDFRPGMKAAEELGIISPLKEAGLTKEEIRKLSKRLELPTWNKPEGACFATRFPYGEEITEDKLAMVKKAEAYLKKLDFKQLRVRHHGELARIEVTPPEREKLFKLELMDEVAAKLEEIGFNYVTVDLAGYRTGSMNEVLTD